MQELEKQLILLQSQAISVVDLIFLRLLREYLNLLSHLFSRIATSGNLSWQPLNRFNRLNKGLEIFDKKTRSAYADVENEVREAMRKTFVEQTMFNEYSAYIQSAQEMGFDIPSSNVIDQILENPIDKMKLPRVLEKHRAEIVREIQASMTQGVIQGGGFEKVAQDIIRRTEISLNKARMVARTEIGRARSEANRKVEKQLQEDGFEVKKYWLSTLDNRTRDTHRKLDTKPADEAGYFHSNGHKAQGPKLFGVASEDINCRCTTINTLPKFRRARNYNDPKYQERLKKRIKELEEDLTPSQARKRAEKEILPPNEKIEWMSYDEWKKSLDSRNQKRYNKSMIEAGGIYGAWNDRNDPDEKHRKKHAEMFYESVRNRDIDTEISLISKNTKFSKSEIEDIYNHVFIKEHELEDGRRRFDPDYDMAESWKRLREGSDIQNHDLILLDHELHELNLMHTGLSYSEAHDLTNEKYNYQKALIKWKIERGDL